MMGSSALRNTNRSGGEEKGDKYENLKPIKHIDEFKDFMEFLKFENDDFE